MVVAMLGVLGRRVPASICSTARESIGRETARSRSEKSCERSAVLAGRGACVARRRGIRSGSTSARRHSAIPSHQTKLFPVTSPTRISCSRGPWAIGPTWAPRTIANQLAAAGVGTPATTGTGMIDRQVGHSTRSPAEAGPSSRSGCPHLSQKKVKGEAVSGHPSYRH